MAEFINPYNFVPLTKQKKIYRENEEEKFTGVIEYSVLTKTPLFIPNTSNDQAFHASKEYAGKNTDAAAITYPADEKGSSKTESKDKNDIHKSEDFFSYHMLSPDKEYDDIYFEPVIPGSEIRGMFRSSYEILSESCMSAIDDEVVLSSRSSQCFEAGLIYKKSENEYVLFEANDNLWRVVREGSTKDLTQKWDKASRQERAVKSYKRDDFKEGEKVYFKRDTRKNKAAKALAYQVGREKTMHSTVEGYILEGEDGPSLGQGDAQLKKQKHVCHIFSIKTKNQAKLSSLDLSQLERTLKMYQDNGEHPYTEYAKQLQNFKKGKAGAYFPVYYSIPMENDKSIYYLSPACITREVYVRKLSEIIDTFQSCTDANALCPGCELFGTVAPDFAHASKVRFSDLRVQGDREAKEYYNAITTLLPLSSPKISSMEFYLKMPKGAKYWTYDYYISQNGTKAYQPEIMGRKFYWHKMIQDNDLMSSVEKTNQNLTIRSVKSGVRFQGKLYFDKIDRKELEQLIWLLNIGEDGSLEQKKHGYKLGAAKPLGLGSIATGVDRVIIRKVRKNSEKRTIEYIEEEMSADNFTNPFEESVSDSYKEVLKFDAVPKNLVMYPIKKDQETGEEGFKWFVENHGGATMKNSRQQMVYKQHMEPCVGELADTPATKENGVSRTKKGYRNNGGGKFGNGFAKNKSFHSKDENPTQEAVIETAEVIYNKNAGKSLRFKIGDKKAQTIPGKEIGLSPEELIKEYPEHTKIKVQYLGQEINGAGKIEKYKLIGKCE